MWVWNEFENDYIEGLNNILFVKYINIVLRVSCFFATGLAGVSGSESIRKRKCLQSVFGALRFGIGKFMFSV